MIGLGSHDLAVTAKLVVHLRAALVNAVKAIAIFETFDSIDAEHSSTKFGMQLTKFRLTYANRAALDDTGYNATNRITFGLHRRYQLHHGNGLLSVWATHVIAFDF